MAADHEPMTDEAYAEMQAALSAEASRRMKIAAEAKAGKLKPLTDLMASDAWAALRDGAVPAANAAIGETYWPTVDALRQIVALLDEAVPMPAS